MSLKLAGLTKRFGAVEVLHGIDLEIGTGEFLVLLGESGCGKSTLLNCIAGLEEVSAGTIAINGQDVTRSEPSERDVAMVFQSYALYPTMNVARNISFGLECQGVSRAERRRAVERVSGLLRISELLDRKPSQLSGGQRQRVAIGRALVRDRFSSCSTSRCPTWMPSCETRCGRNCANCIGISEPRSSW